MYLSELDIVAVTIALVSLMALVITSATANARLTRQRDDWRDDALWATAEADEAKEEVARLNEVIKSLNPSVG